MIKQAFKNTFEKIAKFGNLLKTIPKSARGTGMISRVSRGVGDIAEKSLKPAAKSKIPAGVSRGSGEANLGLSKVRSAGNSHADYMRSIGATGKPNKVKGEVLTYKPSSTRAGLSEFSSISSKPKTKINPERGPLKKS